MNHFEYHHESGESEVVPLSADEVASREADYEAWLAAKEAFAAERDRKAQVKAEALAKLGLSDDEIEAIFG